jgi:hypothetical protein
MCYTCQAYVHAHIAESIRPWFARKSDFAKITCRLSYCYQKARKNTLVRNICIDEHVTGTQLSLCTCLSEHVTGTAHTCLFPSNKLSTASRSAC